MKLPWGFYADVLCILLTGVGLTFAWLIGSLEMIVYHVGIGFIMTWHLENLVTKFASQHLNEKQENQNDSKCE